MKCTEIQDKFYKYLKKELGITSKDEIAIRNILNLYTNKNQMKKINLCWLFEHGIINDVPHFKTEFKDEVKSIKEFVKNINYEFKI